MRIPHSDPLSHAFHGKINRQFTVHENTTYHPHSTPFLLLGRRNLLFDLGVPIVVRMKKGKQDKISSEFVTSRYEK